MIKVFGSVFLALSVLTFFIGPAYSSFVVADKFEGVLFFRILGTLFFIASTILFIVSLRLEDFLGEVSLVQTARGSTYKYLSDGKTQRYKSAEGKFYEPQDALVFIPDWKTVQAAAPRELTEKNAFGENPAQYDQLLLSYVLGEGKRSSLVNEQGERVNSAQEIKSSKRLFLAFQTKAKGSSRTDLFIPVTTVPSIGYYTYDNRRYRENGKELRERHMGNRVVKIVFKNGKVLTD